MGWDEASDVEMGHRERDGRAHMIRRRRCEGSRTCAAASRLGIGGGGAMVRRSWGGTVACR
jgi:hypothetical protein